MCLGPSLTSNMLKTRLWNSSTKPVLLFHQHSRSLNASRSHLEPQGLTLCVINEQCPNRRYWNSSINDLISIIYTMWTTCHYSVIIIIISSKCHRILNPVKNWIETSSHRVKVRPFNYHKGLFQKYSWPSIWASKGNHPSSSLGITAPQSACCIWKNHWKPQAFIVSSFAGSFSQYHRSTVRLLDNWSPWNLPNSMKA